VVNMMEHLPIHYYDVMRKLAEIGRWPFKIEKVVTERKCYETVRKGEVCKEEGYARIGEEVEVTLNCEKLVYMDTTGFGAHEHYSAYLCELDTVDATGVWLGPGKYIGPKLAEFVMEVYGTDYDFSYRLGKVLWVYNAEKGRIVVLPKGEE